MNYLHWSCQARWQRADIETSRHCAHEATPPPHPRWAAEKAALTWGQKTHKIICKQQRKTKSNLIIFQAGFPEMISFSNIKLPFDITWFLSNYYQKHSASVHTLYQTSSQQCIFSLFLRWRSVLQLHKRSNDILHLADCWWLTAITTQKSYRASKNSAYRIKPWQQTLSELVNLAHASHSPWAFCT